MKRSFTAAIAWRYLISKKSHGAVGTISTVSVCAMAVATAAIICVLSVFNGFRQIIASKLDTLSPDIMITPAQGKVFGNATGLCDSVAVMPEVALATPTLSDNALVICNSQEMPVTLKGVIPGQYARITQIRNMIPDGFGSYIDEQATDLSAAPAVFAVGVASRLQAYPDFGALVFAPRRNGRVNLANPGASFLSDSLVVTGVYRTDQSQYDEDGVIVPLDIVRSLLQYDDEASAIEIKLKPGINAEKAVSEISSRIGPKYVVRDRLRQQEMNFRMISIEKWVSFLLLGFILVIAGFNIISSLSMLVLEKESETSTLAALGLSRKRIGRIFAWESIYVSAAGGIAGVILGLTLCLLQQEFGIIRLGGDPTANILEAYPVQVKALDILVTLAPVMAIGLITAVITAAFARSRVSKSNQNS